MTEWNTFDTHNEVTWNALLTHPIHIPQGAAVVQNVSSGVIISTRSLVLQRVGRFHAGLYACMAANDRGENQSAVVHLRIHCEYHRPLLAARSTASSILHYR